MICTPFINPGDRFPLEPSLQPVAGAVARSHGAALLTPREAAKRLGICEKTLWTLTNRGRMRSVKIGRSVRYDPADLNQWIESAKTTP